jgi:SAM-dependent methyltransferase
MSVNTAFEEINEVKADMDYIYDQPDPRAYFHELQLLDYAIPGVAKPIFQKLISLLAHQRNDSVHVLDLGCSYGVNAALLKHDLSMSELYEHWGQSAVVAATPEEVVTCDRRFFGNLGNHQEISVTGLDQAKSAVAYGEKVGLLDEGLAVNLEMEPLPEAARENLALVDLVISTGCVGYVTEKSFESLLPALTQGQLPWIGNFVLRMFPFDSIEETLNDWGYVTEKLECRTFVQRNFASAEEQEQVLERVKRPRPPSGDCSQLEHRASHGRFEPKANMRQTGSRPGPTVEIQAASSGVCRTVPSTVMPSLRAATISGWVGRSPSVDSHSLNKWRLRSGSGQSSYSVRACKAT